MSSENLNFQMSEKITFETFRKLQIRRCTNLQININTAQGHTALWGTMFDCLK